MHRISPLRAALRNGERTMPFAACQLDCVLHRRSRLDLVDAGVVHAAGDGGLRSHGRDEDDVARHENHDLRLIAMQQQVVQVEVNVGPAGVLDLNIPHTALRQRAARGEERVVQRREGPDGVGAGPACRPHDKHLNRPQLTPVDVEIEVPVHTA
jgi:hypothetical protein